MSEAQLTFPGAALLAQMKDWIVAEAFPPKGHETQSVTDILKSKFFFPKVWKFCAAFRLKK